MAETTHVLWTGGWDSTYRMLALLSWTDEDIQPHYVIDPARTSSAIEIETMESLRAAIGAVRPEWEGRIRQLITRRVPDIPADAEIDAALDHIRAEGYLGQQYGWLARYVKACEVGRMDLCIESTDTAGSRLSDRIYPVSGVRPPNYALATGDDALHTVFCWFSFPLIYADKNSMEVDIDQRGLWGIMCRTWFCHQPVFGRYACGTCRPCVYVMNKRQTWRMGYLGLTRFYLIEKPKRILPRNFKSFLRRSAGNRVKRFIRS